MSVSRRTFLLSAAAAALVPSALPASAKGPSTTPAFPSGVASGDPRPDAVVLWTRLGAARQARWVVARDEGLTDVVASGRVTTGPDRDGTATIDVTGLRPGTTYHYAFIAAGQRSPVGRTRTAPAGRTDHVRLAVVTCADWTRGLYNAYARVAERDDLDLVVHLGDYLYEHGKTDRVRPHDPPRELRTLSDYRARWAQYRTDPALAALHRRHPVAWVWDDHETCDGTWRDGADPSNHDDAEDGPFAARKAAALQATMEWMPVRQPDPADPERIWRHLPYGDLVDLFLIDTRRYGRDQQVEPDEDLPLGFRRAGAVDDPQRQLLGAAQEAWLFDGLRSSTATWKIIANQVVLSPLKAVGAPEATGQSVYANPDQWDGYPQARDRLLDVLDQVDDVVVLTGDVHLSLAFEVARDPNNPAAYDPVTGRGASAVELVAPSISSAGDPAGPDLEKPDNSVEGLVVAGFDALRVPNPHLKHTGSRNGYLLVDLTRDRVLAEFWTVPTVLTQTTEQELAEAFVVPQGRSVLLPAAVGQVPTPASHEVAGVGRTPTARVARSLERS